MTESIPSDATKRMAEIMGCEFVPRDEPFGSAINYHSNCGRGELSDTVKVTQADRDLANFIVSQTRGYGINLPSDDDSRIQAVAQYRIAHSSTPDPDLIAERDRLREALSNLLDYAENAAHQIEGEWCSGRSLEQMEADGDLGNEIISARAALRTTDQGEA